jgi:hypothetical protein
MDKVILGQRLLAIGTQQNYPHLLEAILMHDGTLDSLNFNPQEQGISGGPVGFNSAISKSIISAMEKTLTKGGTAYTACAKVAGPGACDARLGIAGKTGTPGDIDERSLSQLRDESASRTRCLEDKKLGCTELFPFPRPRYRWYAALYKSGSSLEYDKAIAVLVHSNWRLSDGRYADENSAAAEIAMRFILAARKVLRAQNQLNVQSSGGSP